MIIRIFGEGQYKLPETSLAGMAELAEATQAAMDARDQERFRDLHGHPARAPPPDGHPAGRR